MKRSMFIALVAFLLFTSSNVNAQFKVGGGLAYANEINNVGISINTGYDFSENWAAEVDFTYFFKHNMLTFSSFDFDGNYFFNFGLYPLLGLNINIIGVHIPDLYIDGVGNIGAITASTTEFGFNMGLGYRFNLGESLSFSPEMRYTVGGFNYFRAGLKLMYQF